MKWMLCLGNELRRTEYIPKYYILEIEYIDLIDGLFVQDEQ